MQGFLPELQGLGCMKTKQTAVYDPIIANKLS